ncbi:D-alanyl-D-alanine carboxypeptidase family protein [Caldicellulosiruptoraceae bacterium PP1]
MLKNIKFFVLINLLVLLLFSNLIAYASQDIKISSVSAIAIDANTGQVLYQKNPHERLYPASTTKLITALVALEKEKNLNKLFTVSKNATLIELGSSSFYLTEGETISFKDLLYTLLLISANDSANVIAENISGSISSFVNEMNNYALNLGLKDTHFENPNGLHNDNHYTSAYDLSILASKAYKNKIIRDIVKTESYTVNTASKHIKPYSKIIYNINKLIRKNSKYYYKYANGMKTGYTTHAKRTLVASAYYNNMNIIVVTLKSENAFDDAIKIFNYVFDNFEKREIIANNAIVDTVYVNDKDNIKVPVKVYNKEAFFSLVEKNNSNNIKFEKIYNKLSLPIKKDAEVGKLNIYYSDYLLGSVKLYSLEDVSYKRKISINNFALKSTKILLYICLFIFLLFMVFFLILVFILKKKKKKIRLKETSPLRFTTLIRKK